MNPDAQMNLTIARDRCADADLFFDRLQAAVSLDGIMERRTLGLARYHLGEVIRLLGGKDQTTAPAPTVAELVNAAKAIVQEAAQ